MSEDDELRKLREQRMEQLRRQQIEQQQQQRDQQEALIEAQKQMLLRKILSSDARSRLANIRLARPQYAQQIEMQLLQIFQSGRLQGQIPLSDIQFKNLLKKLHELTQKRDRKIEFR